MSQWSKCARRSVYILLVGFFTSGSAVSEELTYYIVEGITAPFQITTSDRYGKGYITDIVEALAAETNQELSSFIAPSPRIERLLADPTKKDWIAYHSPAWNILSEGKALKQKVLDVTHSILECTDTHTHLEAHAESLKGHRVAVLKHFRYPGLSKLAVEGLLHLVPVKDYKQGFDLLELERVDGFVEMDIRLRFNLNLMPDATRCSHISSIGSVEPIYPIHLYVSKKMPEERVTKLNQGLEQLKKNGFFDKTLKKYTDP